MPSLPAGPLCSGTMPRLRGKRARRPVRCLHALAQPGRFARSGLQRMRGAGQTAGNTAFLPAPAPRACRGAGTRHGGQRGGLSGQCPPGDLAVPARRPDRSGRDARPELGRACAAVRLGKQADLCLDRRRTGLPVGQPGLGRAVGTGLEALLAAGRCRLVCARQGQHRLPLPDSAGLAAGRLPGFETAGPHRVIGVPDARRGKDLDQPRPRDRCR